MLEGSVLWADVRHLFFLFWMARFYRQRNGKAFFLICRWILPPLFYQNPRLYVKIITYLNTLLSF